MPAIRGRPETALITMSPIPSRSNRLDRERHVDQFELAALVRSVQVDRRQLVELVVGIADEPVEIELDYAAAAAPLGDERRMRGCGEELVADLLHELVALVAEDDVVAAERLGVLDRPRPTSRGVNEIGVVVQEILVLEVLPTLSVASTVTHTVVPEPRCRISAVRFVCEYCVR